MVVLMNSSVVSSINGRGQLEGGMDGPSTVVISRVNVIAHSGLVCSWVMFEEVNLHRTLL